MYYNLTNRWKYHARFYKFCAVKMIYFALWLLSLVIVSSRSEDCKNMKFNQLSLVWPYLYFLSLIAKKFKLTGEWYDFLLFAYWIIYTLPYLDFCSSKVYNMCEYVLQHATQTWLMKFLCVERKLFCLYWSAYKEERH